MGGSHTIAKGFEIFERPDDFLVAGDFKKLWVFRAGMAIAYNDVAPGVAFDTTSKLFLVSEYDRCVEISTSNGMVTAVRSLNV